MDTYLFQELLMEAHNILNESDEAYTHTEVVVAAIATIIINHLKEDNR